MTSKKRFQCGHLPSPYPHNPPSSGGWKTRGWPSQLSEDGALDAASLLFCPCLQKSRDFFMPQSLGAVFFPSWSHFTSYLMLEGDLDGG